MGTIAGAGAGTPPAAALPGCCRMTMAPAAPSVPSITAAPIAAAIFAWAQLIMWMAPFAIRLDAPVVETVPVVRSVVTLPTSAGGTSSQSVTIKRDATPPSVSATPSPAPNSNGWNNTDVTVTYTGSDAMSGLDSCEAADVLSSEGAGQNASGTGPHLTGFEAVDASLATTSVSVTGAVFDGLGNVLFASAFDDSVTGSAAADIILGNAGADVMSGGAGDDTIIADAGNDTLTGGPGADAFFYPGGAAAGSIVIADFAPGEDAMLLSAALFATPEAVLAAIAKVGDDAVLTVAGQSAILLGVDAATLGVDDVQIV